MNEKVFYETEYSLHYLNIIKFVNEYFSKHLKKQWHSWQVKEQTLELHTKCLALSLEYKHIPDVSLSFAMHT